jgi:hypothetical protein
MITTQPLALPAPGPVTPSRGPSRPRRLPAEQKPDDPLEKTEDFASSVENAGGQSEKQEEPPRQQAVAQMLIARDDQLPEVMRLKWIGPSLGFFIQIYVQEHMGSGMHFDPWRRAAAAYEHWQNYRGRQR